MEREISGIIEHMASSQMQMSKILEAERQVAVRMAHLTNEIPLKNPSFGTIEALTELSLNATKSIAAYLGSLADLQDAIADNLLLVMKQLEDSDEDE